MVASEGLTVDYSLFGMLELISGLVDIGMVVCGLFVYDVECGI